MVCFQYFGTYLNFPEKSLRYFINFFICLESIPYRSGTAGSGSASRAYADPEPDPAKWWGSDPILVRVHNTVKTKSPVPVLRHWIFGHSRILKWRDRISVIKWIVLQVKGLYHERPKQGPGQFRWDKIKNIPAYGCFFYWMYGYMYKTAQVFLPSLRNSRNRDDSLKFIKRFCSLRVWKI